MYRVISFYSIWMKKIFTLFLLVILNMTLMGVAVYADDAIWNQPRLFAKLNPDGMKYEFLKYYLTALQYLEKVDALQAQAPEILFNDLTLDVLNSRADHLLQENANIRVARNYVDRYRNSKNGFFLKVNKIFLHTCESLISLNSQEHELILSLISRDISGLSFDGKAKEDYLIKQNQWADQRKSVSAGILEASIYASKLLLSSQLDSGDTISRLGISAEQRQILKDFLDDFSYTEKGTDILPGQTYVEGSVAVIRKVLEDDSLGTIDW